MPAWKCPRCARVYQIPASFTAPELCPACRVDATAETVLLPPDDPRLTDVDPKAKRFPFLPLITGISGGLALLFWFEWPAGVPWTLLRFFSSLVFFALAIVWLLPTLVRLPAWLKKVLENGAVVPIVIALQVAYFNLGTSYEYAEGEKGLRVSTRLWGWTPIWREYRFPDGDYGRGPLSPSKKKHGQWDEFLLKKFERVWYWYDEPVTEGEWHVRNK